jgi:DNA-binding transcriptional MerR regulator
MLIGRVAELTGASRKAIRHYESIGLIEKPERLGSYRNYTDHDVVIISMIKRAQSLGFNLAELKELVLQKTLDKKLPMELACSLIDTKLININNELESLVLKQQNLEAFKIDLIKNFT